MRCLEPVVVPAAPQKESFRVGWKGVLFAKVQCVRKITYFETRAVPDSVLSNTPLIKNSEIQVVDVSV